MDIGLWNGGEAGAGAHGFFWFGFVAIVMGPCIRLLRQRKGRKILRLVASVSSDVNITNP
jgi:hypothetical protein